MIDTHQLMPTGDAVRSAISRLNASPSGARVARAGASAADLANSARLYMKLLKRARSPRLTPAALADAQGVAAALAPDDRSLQAERARGWGSIHRDWLAADATGHLQLQQKWHELFRLHSDAVVLPGARPCRPFHAPEPFDARHSTSMEISITTPMRALGRSAVRPADQQPPFRSSARRRGCQSACSHRAVSRRPHDDCAGWVESNTSWGLRPAAVAVVKIIGEVRRPIL